MLIKKKIIDLIKNIILFFVILSIFEILSENKINNMLDDYKLINYSEASSFEHREILVGSKLFNRLVKKILNNIFFKTAEQAK